MRWFHALLRKCYGTLSGRNDVRTHVRRGLVVGRNFKMLTEVILDYSHIWHIEIGDDVTMAPRVHILTHDASTKTHLGYTRIGKVRIGNRVFIGASAIVLPGVVIGDDVIIGAGSVVTRDVPDGQVVSGNPARLICSTDDYLSRKRKEMEIYPRFGEEYTIEKNVTDEMKEEMTRKMKDRFGYIY